MQVCGQTLVLVDCSDAVSQLNQDIVEATLKYMFRNGPDNRAYSISTYGHKVDSEEDFVMDRDILCRKVDELEYVHKDINLTDTLCDVLKHWHESDFACRDIVVFTSGIEEQSRDYTREELFYLIDNTSYPIYVVDLVQADNSNVRKELSAIATVSDGELFLTEFEGDDAEVERQISDRLYNCMEEYAREQWSVYEIADEERYVDEIDVLELDESGADIVLDEVPYAEREGEIIYKEPIESEGRNMTSYVVLAVVVALMLILIGIFIGYLYMLRRRYLHKMEEKTVAEVKKELVRNSQKSNEIQENDDYAGDMTQILNEDFADEKFNDTVLLGECMNRRMQLIDVEESNSLIDLFLGTSKIIGRKRELCDMVINDESVSKRHCEVGYAEEGYYVRDLNSSNGLYLNGTRIQCVYINDGDILGIGKRRYRIKIV